MSLFLVLAIFINAFHSQQLQYPLRVAAENSNAGIFVGAALNYPMLNNDSQYAAVAAQQYNLITSVNGCKFGPTEPKENEFNFTECDYNYNFAVKNNMTFRGHNLIWGVNNPWWLTSKNWTESQLQSIMNNHITTVIQRYNNSPGIYSWDVVNEAVR